MASKFKFTEDTSVFIESFCAACSDGEFHYFIPYVFKPVEGRVNTYEMIPVNDKRVKHIVEDFTKRVRPFSVYAKEPMTPKEALAKLNLEGEFDPK